jgi:hypothetical protein
MSDQHADGKSFPAVHIDRRHQSAPSETDGDKAVRLAAEEISAGKWKLPEEAAREMNEVPGLALRDGVTPDVKPWTQEDFDRTDQSLVLGEHPRVQEALARMEREKSEAHANGQKYVELAAMMHETVEESRRRQRWDGQERWTEDDAVEAAMGKILSPLDFYTQLLIQGLLEPPRIGNVHDFPVKQMEWEEGVLCENQYWIRTIGTGRIRIGRDVKKRHTTDRSGRIALLMIAHSDSPIETPGLRTATEEPVQVATLQWPFGTEWMVMKFDEFGVPTTPRFIGWRTALLALVRNGAITAEEANRAFPVGTGPRASWYRQMLFEFQERR